MIRLFGRGLAVLLLASSFSVMAQDAVTGEPDVTIREEGDRTVRSHIS